MPRANRQRENFFFGFAKRQHERAAEWQERENADDRDAVHDGRHPQIKSNANAASARPMTRK